MASEVDGSIAARIGTHGCREYELRYLASAGAYRRKYGKRADYRRQWLEAAWFFRSKGVGAGHWSTFLGSLN